MIIYLIKLKEKRREEKRERLWLIESVKNIFFNLNILFIEFLSLNQPLFISIKTNIELI